MYCRSKTGVNNRRPCLCQRVFEIFAFLRCVIKCIPLFQNASCIMATDIKVLAILHQEINS
jgi:hypothetical protein